MTQNIDLTATPVIPKEKVPQTTVAIFKEEAEVPRVLGESDAFIAYTLKNRRAIRVICRANNERAAFRKHEGVVHDLRFVNFHSNVAASASEKDFFVWVAVLETVEAAPGEKKAPTHVLTVKPYFKLVDPVVVQCFHFFINPTNTMPDLLLLYDKSAAVLESSKLISEYKAEMLNATLGEQSHELRKLPQEASSKSLCSTFSGGWLAFTAEATRVMACTLRNPATPAWSGCEGEEIVQLCFVGSAAATESAATTAAAAGGSAVAANAAANSSTAMLAICSARQVYLWKLTGVAEPVLLRTFTFGNIVTMLSSRNALAVFNDAGVMARVVVQDETKMDAVAYALQAPVRPTSVRYHEGARFATLLVDSVMELNLYELATNSSTNGSPAAKTGKASPNAAVTSAPATAPAAVTASAAAAAAAASAARFVDPSIISTGAPFRPVMNSAPAPSSSSPSTTPVTSAAAINANPMAAMAAYQSARASLQNAMLPQSLDGLVASAVYQSDESVRRDVERLLNVLKNIAQILQLTPDQLLRDHQQLVSLALEAQMTELQQSAAANSATITTTAAAGTPATVAAPVTETSRRHSEAFNSYVLSKLLPPVAKEIAQGVARGLRDTLRGELDSAVNAAFGANVHASQKAVLRKRLDEALQSSVRELGADVAKRVDSYVERELSEQLARVNASMSALEEQNRKLQSALQQIVSSGAVQEVESMRAELAELRAALQRGDSVVGNGDAAGAAAAASAPSPQTVIETSEKYIKEGHVAQGLAYVTMAQNPRCVVQLLLRLSEDEVASVVSDTETPESTWSKLVAQLCDADAVESNAETEVVASFLFDVVSEHEEVISKKTARAQKTRSDVRHLVARARGKVDSSEGRRVLKDLEKSIQ